MSHASEERRALADALLAAGPDAPTLCEGWAARDLAAHLVIREGRPDAGIGILLPPAARWTRHVTAQYAARPFPQLVERFRSGPPRLSVFSLPGAQVMNLAEFFIHTEDVRRAAPGWTPRELPAARQAALWRNLTGGSRLFFRRARVGVLLRTPDGQEHRASSGTPVVTLTGEPAELLLYAYGRGAHARVEVSGTDDAIAEFGKVRLGM